MSSCASNVGGEVFSLVRDSEKGVRMTELWRAPANKVLASKFLFDLLDQSWLRQNPPLVPIKYRLAL